MRQSSEKSNETRNQDESNLAKIKTKKHEKRNLEVDQARFGSSQISAIFRVTKYEKDSSCEDIFIGQDTL